MGLMALTSRTASGASVPGVGSLLRRWREARAVSQLDLALRAGFSARHVSFIETGRAQASRDALLTLAEALDIPLRDRNRLLEAGGYAPVFRSTPLSADEMGHIRGVLQFILDRHLPYAAVVLDRYANCVMGNGASGRLLRRFVDPSLLPEHANHLRVIFHPLGLRRVIVNWDEVSRHLLAGAERDLDDADDPVATALLDELRGYAGEVRPANDASLEPGSLLLPVHITDDGIDLRLFSTIMSLGSPRDVTLQDLRIETFFPADAASESAWRALCRAE